MRRIWLLALNDLRLTARDRASFLWMLVLPIAMMWFFGGVGGGGQSGPPVIALSVVDHDDGWLSTVLLEELADESVDLRPIDPQSAESAEDKVRSLVIPVGFTEDVVAGKKRTLRLEREPGSNAQFGMAAQVHIMRAIVRTLARVAEMGGSGPTAASEDDSAAAERYRRLAARPPLVRLEVSSAGRGRPVPSGIAQSVPGNLTFIVLMMTLIYGAVFLTIEKRGGMLRRQSGLPMSRAEIFVGKLGGRVLMALIQIAVLLLAGRFVFGVSWGNAHGGMLLLVSSYAIAVAGMGTLLGAVASTPEQASGLGWILAMVLAAVGGCWWPAEIMPGWMQTLSHAFPTAWAMDGFHALISFGYGIEAVLLPSAVLLGFGAAFSALGARFLRFD